MGYVIDAVTAIRSIRGELNIAHPLEIRTDIKVKSADIENVLKENLSAIMKLTRCREINIGKDIRRAKGSAVSVKEGMEIYIPIEGLLDINSEVLRLKKEIDKIDEDMTFFNKKFLNEDFLKNAPKDIVQKERARFNDLINKKEKIEENIKMLKQIGKSQPPSAELKVKTNN